MILMHAEYSFPRRMDSLGMESYPRSHRRIGSDGRAPIEVGDSLEAALELSISNHSREGSKGLGGTGYDTVDLRHIKLPASILHSPAFNGSGTN
jgi:hypothetical protein